MHLKEDDPPIFINSGILFRALILVFCLLLIRVFSRLLLTEFDFCNYFYPLDLIPYNEVVLGPQLPPPSETRGVVTVVLFMIEAGINFFRG